MLITLKRKAKALSINHKFCHIYNIEHINYSADIPLLKLSHPIAYTNAKTFWIRTTKEQTTTMQLSCSSNQAAHFKTTSAMLKI